MSTVKRLRPRLSAILFKLQFEEQLKDTKSADQKTTLLHFLVEICEEKHPDILNFVDDLEHLDKASKAFSTSAESCVVDSMGSGSCGPKCCLVLSFVSAKEQHEKLSKLHENMEKLYQSIMGYFAIDVRKVSVEDFLSDLSNFRTIFMVPQPREALSWWAPFGNDRVTRLVFDSLFYAITNVPVINSDIMLLQDEQAIKDNFKKREAEEKEKRARIAKELAEKERLERQQKKKRLLEMKTDVFPGHLLGAHDAMARCVTKSAVLPDLHVGCEILLLLDFTLCDSMGNSAHVHHMLLSEHDSGAPLGLIQYSSYRWLRGAPYDFKSVYPIFS
ncbi:hypothetical protein CB1_000842002 [Camelus ferus]|nr:hypothetical protein CB1_000842002 [Camelus ferus]